MPTIGLGLGLDKVRLGSKVNQIKTFNLVVEGHSFVSQSTNLDNFIPESINAETYYNSAVSGASISDVNLRAAIVDSKLISGKNNIMALWIGANNISDVAGSGTTAYNAMKNYIQARLTAGWKIYTWTCTTTASKGATAEAERVIFNNLMRNDLSLLDNIWILDTDTLTELSNSNNTTYYSTDKLHLTAGGAWVANTLFYEIMLLHYGENAIPVIPETNLTELTLTATGTGAGIALLQFTSSERVIISVDGNAKIYRDAAATIGESQKWVVIPSGTIESIRTVYIKCTSGTAKLNIEKNKIEKIISWASSTNAPSLGGSIEALTNLKWISTAGTNTLSGSISGMVDIVRLLNTGANTLSGSISLLTKLNYVHVEGSNTISGDVSNLIDLTFLTLRGANSISGSITNLTKLTTLRVDFLSTNTLSGTIANMPNLTFVNIAGNNTVKFDLAATPSLVNYVYLAGKNEIDTYTAGHTWADSFTTFLFRPFTPYALSVAELSSLIIDFNTSWTTARVASVDLKGNNASMADTAQGGIWGDFSGTATPSALATAYKSLIRTKLRTTDLNGVAVPGVSGDGTGFPAGFGNWYRS